MAEAGEGGQDGQAPGGTGGGEAAAGAGGVGAEEPGGAGLKMFFQGYEGGNYTALVPRSVSMEEVGEPCHDGHACMRLPAGPAAPRCSLFVVCSFVCPWSPFVQLFLGPVLAALSLRSRVCLGVRSGVRLRVSLACLRRHRDCPALEQLAFSRLSSRSPSSL